MTANLTILSPRSREGLLRGEAPLKLMNLNHGNSVLESDFQGDPRHVVDAITENNFLHVCLSLSLRKALTNG